MLTKKTIKPRNGHAVECFVADSVAELANESLIATKKHSNPFGREDKYTNYSFQTWIGRPLDSFEDAVKAANLPWEYGLTTVQSMIDNLQHTKLPVLTTRKRRQKWREDDGDDIDLDRMRSGQAFWKKASREKVRGQGTVTILSDMRAACSLSADQILWRGAASIVLTYLLERAGYRVEMWSGQAGRYVYEDRSDMFVAARVKYHRDPLNIGVAASSISAWYYRTVGFHAANLCYNKNPTYLAGYDREGGLEPFVSMMTKDDHVFIVQNIWNRQNAMEFIRSAAEALERGDLTSCKWSYSWMNSKYKDVMNYEKR